MPRNFVLKMTEGGEARQSFLGNSDLDRAKGTIVMVGEGHGCPV
jgi:hypothetical protein